MFIFYFYQYTCNLYKYSQYILVNVIQVVNAKSKHKLLNMEWTVYAAT